MLRLSKDNIMKIYTLLIEGCMVFCVLFYYDNLNVSSVFIILANLHIMSDLFSLYNYLNDNRNKIIFISSLILVFISIMLLMVYFINQIVLIQNINTIITLSAFLLLKFYTNRFNSKLSISI